MNFILKWYKNQFQGIITQNIVKAQKSNNNYDFYLIKFILDCIFLMIK